MHPLNSIKDTLDYDFAAEKQFSYEGLSVDQHRKANYGVLAEEGIYLQSRRKAIRQVGSADLRISQ